jgi:uncharacterized protein involved in outer membrane biogenesis
MKKPLSKRRGLFWLIGGVVVLAAAILVALTILLPRFINSAEFRKKIATGVSERIGGRVTFEAIDLSFFPLLQFVIRDVNLSIPTKVYGTVGSVRVYSEILPLLTGKVRIAKIHLSAPNFDLILPSRAMKQAAGPPAFSLAALREQLPVQLNSWAIKAPGLVVSVEKARIRLLDEDQPRFTFSEFNARVVLPPKSAQIEMDCRSSLWEMVSLKASLASATLKGKGRIELTDFQPGPLAGYLSQAGAPIGSASRVSLRVDLATEGLRDLKGAFQGAIPNLTIPQEGEDLVIRAKTLTGTFDLDEEKLVFALTEMSGDYPLLDMGADFHIDRKGQQVSMKLDGRDVDVASTRRTVLGLAGGVPAVRKVFDIVKGGKVPLVTIETRGASFADLKKLDNIRIEGRILDGTVRPPSFQVDVENVKGEVVIAKGILEGQNLEGREGKAWGRNGTLRVGLRGKDGPFQLDIEIDTDIAMVPPELNRFIKSTTFRNEMKLIKGLQGRAIGRLTLGETLDSIKTQVEVSQLDLSAQYERMPFPVQISAGRFSFRDGAIAVRDLNGSLGKTSFSKLTATLSLEKKSYLDVKSGAFRIAAGEIYPWLSSFEALSWVFGKLAMERFTGRIRFDTVKLKGPLLAPDQWKWEASGDITDLVVKTGLFPATIQMPGGEVHFSEEAERQRVTFKNAQFTVRDASLKVSGTLDDYLKGLNRVDITVTGSMGSESSKLLSTYIEIPSELDLRWSPMSTSNAHLVWERDRLISFEGALVIQEGPNVSLGLLLKPEELHIQNLSIEDEESRAAFALHLDRKALEFKFYGNLAQASLDKISRDTEFGSGRMEGDLQAKIDLQQPLGSTAQGSLTVQDFVMPLNLEAALKIEEVSLMADGPHARIDSGRFSCGENVIALTGDMTLSSEGLTLDMDVSSPDFDLEGVLALFGLADQDSEPEESEKVPALPLRGELRFKADALKVQDVVWRPLEADVTFSPNRVLVKVAETSELCGISTPGTLEFTPRQISLAFQPTAKDKALEPTVDCFFGEKKEATGRFNFKGDVKSQGVPDELLRSLQGNLVFDARDGHIKQELVMKRLLSFLNLTEVFRGKLPDFRKEGLKFYTMKVRATLQAGKLKVKEAYMRADVMDVAIRGDVDYIDGQLDLRVLVSPLKTVDAIVRVLPVVKQIFGGTLISIPVRIRGHWEDPKVKTMAAEDVAQDLIDIVENIATLPVTVIEPEIKEVQNKEAKK